MLLLGRLLVAATSMLCTRELMAISHYHIYTVFNLAFMVSIDQKRLYKLLDLDHFRASLHECLIYTNPSHIASKRRAGSLAL